MVTAYRTAGRQVSISVGGCRHLGGSAANCPQRRLTHMCDDGCELVVLAVAVGAWVVVRVLLGGLRMSRAGRGVHRITLDGGDGEQVPVVLVVMVTGAVCSTSGGWWRTVGV